MSQTQSRAPAGTVRAKPSLSFWQIWNMCFGFLGLQFGFALQNANVSRIFQALGASLDDIPALWIAAPLTGLLVQPVIGYFSDRTWTRLGRRRPYFVVGAVLASAALLAMPRAPALWIAAGLLWLLDASINISMEPFRAFVGDQLPPVQRSLGYALQSFFIGIGAVVASMLPWALHRLGLGDTVAGTVIPNEVRLSFDLGAIVLLLAILWTVLRTREYPPAELLGFADARSVPATAPTLQPVRGAAWLGAGVAGIAALLYLHLDRQLLLIFGGMAVWGIALLLRTRLAAGGMFVTVMDDLGAMPLVMRRLVPVQFFSWLALFSMWIYTTAAVAARHFGSADATSAAFNEGANWVGVLFGAYNGFAALAAGAIPLLVRRIGLQRTHLVNLWLGAAGLISFLVIRDPSWLLLSMVGVGFAWASILSLPYALLSDGVPAAKMGTYMGIFNFFIVIPQLVAASVLGLLLRTLFGGQPIYALLLGGLCFVLAGVLSLRVPQAAR